MKKKHWLKSEFHLEKWMHKHLLFKDDKEFAIFLAWAVVVAVLLFNVK